MSNQFSFNEEQFNRLFPFYMLINRDMKVVSKGVSINKLYDWKQVKLFNQFFKIPRPYIQINSFQDLIKLENQMLVLEGKDSKNLKLRGQFEYLKDSDEMLFVGSPWFGSMEQVRENNLMIEDFARHDPLIDLLNVLKSQEITTEDLKDLIKTINKQKNELKKANKEFYDIALFPKQNPDPNIRINYKGDLLQNNPAAANLDFIEYKGNTYRNDVFFKKIVNERDLSLTRWSFEASSNDIDYSFDCVAMPEDGYINIYGRDITQQKLNQQEIEKLSLIVQETTSSVIVADSKGKVEWVNKAFEKITGYKIDDAKGISPGKLLQGEKTDQKRAAFMRQKVKEGQPFTCEIYNYKKSGEGYWGRVNAQPIYDKKGKVINYFALKEDITAEKLAKEKLRKASIRMSSLITNLHVGILLENNENKISLINKHFCEIFNINVSPEQLIGADCSNSAEQSKHLFSNPELFIKEINQIVVNKELVIGDQLKMADGRILGRDYVPIWNDGIYEGHLWMYTDITEKINANKKIEDLRVFYEKILDNIPSDIAVFDENYNCLYVNPRGIRDQILRKSIIENKDDESIKKKSTSLSFQEIRNRAFKEIIKSKKLKSWEEEFKNSDGTSLYKMRNLYPVVNSSNEIDLVIGYGVDITNIKTIQQQIVDSEKRYRDVINSSLAIITTHSLDGVFLDINPMVHKLYGYENNDVIGHYLTDFMPEEDKILFGEKYLSKIKKEKEASGIFRILHKNGNIVYTLYNNFLKEEAGKEPYVISFGVDITQRILVEKALKKEKKITEELAQTKQNFLANMSHEIRTPMNAIMGMSRQLQKSSLNEQQQSYLRNITNASENLLVIINDVLDLAKLEAGKLSIEKIGFRSGTVVEGVMQVMMHKAEEKGIELTNSFCDPALHSILIGDPYRINQVLLNLISNAIKFTSIGGVDISCKVLSENENSQEIQIKVSDTGIGMDASFLKNLFKKFTQEYQNSASKFGGTGLGMSISKSLVEAMGGDIFAESEKGKGTTVYTTFTLQKGTELDLPRKNSLHINTDILKNKKILVVDDNKMNRMVATLILKEFQVVVSEVENGAEAVDYLKRHSCDLVLMDLQMPVLNGYDASKVIRNELKSTIPIIALTANAIKGESDKCFLAGMNDYLSKPFEEEQFLHVVTHWIDKTKGITTVYI
jgi:PAS domain S-box-containing protein